jgi:outer membrane protein OmpA-like peptidoglycan-associated protein
MMKRFCFATLLVVLVLTATVHAQGGCEIDIGPWMSWRSALDASDPFGTIGVAAGVALPRGEHWRFRLGVSHRRGSGDALPPTLQEHLPCRQRQTALSIDAIYSFARRGGISPFLGASMSLNSLRVDFDAETVSPSRYRTDQMTPSLIVGIEPRLTGDARLVARTELGYVLSTSDDFPADYSRQRLHFGVGVGISIPLFRRAPSRARPPQVTFPATTAPPAALTLPPDSAIIDTSRDTTALAAIVHDHDRDQDGVTDSLDHCPGTPKGMEVDSSGCLVMTQLDKRVVVVVDYRKGSVALDETARLILNDVAIRLKGAPALHATIEGFTDDVGDPTANVRLSQRRANAAKEYLVGRGIAPTRLTATGRGSTLFIADNATDLGRKRNRRLEISFQ